MGHSSEHAKKPTSTPTAPEPVTSAIPAPRKKPHVDPLKAGPIPGFLAVVGRATIGLPIQVTNQTAVGRLIAHRMQGSSFEVTDSPEELTAAAGNQPSGEIAVQFAPKTAGHHTATLHIESYELNDRKQMTERHTVQELHLTGTGIELQEEFVRHGVRSIAGGPEPIHSIPDKPSGDSERQRQVAIEAVSSVATTYNAIVEAGDQAARDFNDRIIRAAGVLDRRIIDWQMEEGIHEMKAGAKQNGLDDAGTIAFMKLFDSVTEAAGPVALAASCIIELGFAVHNANKANAEEGERQQVYQNHAHMAGRHAGSTAQTTTALLMRKFGDLSARYAAARVQFQIAAGPRAQDSLKALSNRGESPLRAYNGAKTILEDAKTAQQNYADALRAIAAVGATIDDQLDRGFSAMLQRYLRERMNPKPDGVTPKVTLLSDWHIADGTINLNGAQFGSYEAMSSTMRHFATDQSVHQFSNVDIELRLRCVQDGGVVVIERRAGQQPVFTAASGLAGSRAKSMGAAELLDLVAGRTMQSRTIRVGS